MDRKMSIYSNLSIMEEDPAKLGWYDHLLGRTEPPKYRLRTREMDSHEYSLREAADERAGGYQTTWYYQVKEQERAQDLEESRRVKEQEVKETLIAQYPPYYEYMFADAELEPPGSTSSDCGDGNEMEDIIFDQNTSACDSPPKDHLVTPINSPHLPLFPSTTSPSKSGAAWQLTDKELPALPQDSSCLLACCTQPANLGYRSDDGPNSPDPLLTTPTYSPITPEYGDHVSASARSSQSLAESPRLSILPVIIEENLISLNDAVVPSSSVTQQLDEAKALVAICRSSKHISTQYDAIPKPLLKPKSQKAKAIRKIQSSAHKVVSALTTSEIPDSEQASETSKATSVQIIKVVKKRRARESFPDRAKNNVTIDDDITYLCTKRARQHTQANLKDIEVESLPRTPISPLGTNKIDSRTVSNDFFKHKALPTPPKGFAGQFEGMFVDANGKAVFSFESHKPLPKTYLRQTFGSPSHPNGTFTHPSFIPCHLHDTQDYTHGNLSEHSAHRQCMTFADNMMETATHPDIAAIRTRDEEILRREVHFECSSARLEGCSVGFYRYHQGSYGLQEYKDAGLCICWDFCHCAKLCTRYGDLRCPCNKDIIVHGDDD